MDDDVTYQSIQYMQEKMHVDFFSGTFYAMRTSMKKKYKLLTSDSADYYIESCFILSI